MENLEVIQKQKDFFHGNHAGCAFAAKASGDPDKFGWRRVIVGLDTSSIDHVIQAAIADPNISTLSMIFPNVNTEEQLLSFLQILETSKFIVLERRFLFENSICLGFRVTVDPFISRVSGFGTFSFLPKTRQAPFVEIAFRVKARPPYEKVMKKSHPGVIHLADMYMLGMGDEKFKSLWAATMHKVAEILGHKPNLKSAAKTTFAIPEELYIKQTQ